ncbi:hypothetical protein BO94DRAFT_68128 [Aspergillus sclerotioniger CBS 115572]|uniref:Uncharacterized protein n=1 Tax=Aspergillus sclerotioniger CBS 115572 TaxID=1450535 RepID=A0A317WM77_9EURO|nr:hypothetical protein BO94DRAFT_68128 [Aspergillus sclerotioniger CBS 115572]PWY87155.1 hypothetical protein BO94DRAFT_68128 [Aspergillus sclerotioniger CBS 115572]
MLEISAGSQSRRRHLSEARYKKGDENEFMFNFYQTAALLSLSFYSSPWEQRNGATLHRFPLTADSPPFSTAVVSWPEIATGGAFGERERVSERGFALPPSVSELTWPCPPRPSRHTLYSYRPVHHYPYGTVQGQPFLRRRQLEINNNRPPLPLDLPLLFFTPVHQQNIRGYSLI